MHKEGANIYKRPQSSRLFLQSQEKLINEIKKCIKKSQY